MTPISSWAYHNAYALAIAATVICNFAIVSWRFGAAPNTADSYSVSNRKEHPLAVAISATASWTWTVLLYVVPQQIYRLGAVAALPFIGINTLCLPFSGWLVYRVRKICGDTQKTLPEFARMRDGKKTEAVLTFAVLGTQIYSVITHLVASSLLIVFLPIDVSIKSYLIIGLAVSFFAIAIGRGIQSSIPADIVKYAVMLGIAWVAYRAFGAAGGLSALEGGISGLRAPGAGLVDANLVWQDILPPCAALLSAVMIDDQLYQRGFAARSHTRGAFFLAGALFLIVAVWLGALGFLAANKELGIKAANVQLVNFATIGHLLPDFPIYALALGFIAVFVASGAGALHAAGNVGAKNVAHMLGLEVPDGRFVLVSRITMLAVCGLGLLIALKGIGILEMWLMWGVFRAGLFFPMLVLITMPKESVPTVFPWIMVELVVSLGCFGWLLHAGSPIVAAANQAILVAWALGMSVFAWRFVTSRLIR